MNSTGKIKPLSDFDKNVRARKLDILRKRLSTPLKVSDTLSFSPEAQKRAELLKKYPQLEGKVRITNEKIIVTTAAGELTFGFNHTEGGQAFENANKPYSKEQLQALVQVFGNTPAPYIDILGMKNTHRDGEETYNYNFYWSLSSTRLGDRHGAWGLYLDASEVKVVYDYRGYRVSALSV